jgi:hypothetical protein
VTTDAAVMERPEIFASTGTPEPRTRAPYFFGADHREEAFALEKSPDLGRQVGEFVRDLPIVQHGAQLVDWTVEKCALLDAGCGAGIEAGDSSSARR